MLKKELNKLVKEAELGYKANGNLAPREIEELLHYEFVAGPGTVTRQFRYSYLKLKDRKPEKAANMLEEAGPLAEKCVRTEQQVHDLCTVLSRYINGFVIRPEPTLKEYEEMAREYSLPLKTMTKKARRPYQVWRIEGRSQLAQWKAWRQGRPTVIGYGMTKQEAIDDLRFDVQPDHDGMLDGLGKPNGPIIGGNMFTHEQVVQNNKDRFP